MEKLLIAVITISFCCSIAYAQKPEVREFEGRQRLEDVADKIYDHISDRQEIDRDRRDSWLDVEPVDEEGSPISHGLYEVDASDGELIEEGSLDSEGQGHTSTLKRGNRTISFPDSDKEEWERE